ncbi:MAG: sortase [Patescibacteria group bacterium]|nr:sortase [Patescibacteria group bacterium]MCL5432438.1 sortase [Patescibacteria group bacterium]
MLYVYTKSDHYVNTYLVDPGRHRRTTGLLSTVFLLVGLFLIGQVVYPVLGWYVFALPTFSPPIVSPLSASAYAPPAVSLPTAALIAPVDNNPSYDASSWFPNAKPFTGVLNTDLRTYTISVPKLKIDEATVEIGGDDLKKSLVAWPTSAVPGNYGVNIIFGHSELPQFASPNNFSGIFTHIMELGQGDVIYVDYDGIRYKYEVVDKTVVEPTDLSVLEQRFDDRYLTLITCVPPGTVWQRGVVKAVMSQS